MFSVNNLPRVHVYAFSTAEDPILDIVERYEKLSLFYDFTKYQILRINKITKKKKKKIK